MVTMFKPSAKEKFVEHAMEYHKINREDAKKLVRALEMIEEVKLTKRIDEVFSKSNQTKEKEIKKTTIENLKEVPDNHKVSIG